ncbi:hypothetical protein NE237_019818 [Protea cynaroides]|uniref:Uncharacterized protein n=1 Tax=Protea cynaroides TaxID=273540 RepID=A0A9Q0H5G7_9MAGN|nr:hypothetical protein NE237_019818 [Protea cynaroides]
MEGETLLQYLTEKLKEILLWLPMEGEKVLQYLMEKSKEILVWLQHFGAILLHEIDEILPPRMKNASLRDWIIWIVVALAVVLVVRKFCSCCCQRGFKMMKAPGRNLRIPRGHFESNPGGYFRNLRLKAPLDPQFSPYKSLV